MCVCVCVCVCVPIPKFLDLAFTKYVVFVIIVYVSEAGSFCLYIGVCLSVCMYVCRSLIAYSYYQIHLI